MSAPKKWTPQIGVWFSERTTRLGSYSRPPFEPLATTSWLPQTPDEVRRRVNREYLHPPYFFGSFHPMPTTAWFPHYPDSVRRRVNVEYYRPSYFHKGFYTIYPRMHTWLTGPYALSYRRRPFVIQPYFFINPKKVPSQRFLPWNDVEAVSGTWNEVEALR